ncbi:branched-chain amino acid ABC transporter permease [Psychrobacillus soli]|uniref:Branched-chain amino acid ABC transporter permease n=1 Tax=Psychrobacillus soli TaxID=1543965 RepID=A0A544TLA4_9BACI|nr:branched-chain amino acid ABC transporter permease [Psychrobacillus soli]TQR18233.1 branched-chain amino acid ABC transporter permease [Psychrobacillus soli]
MMILQTLISGILLGGIYALISMGLNMILGVVRIINFAHGEFLMIAMYLSYIFYAWGGMDPYVSAIFIVIILFVLGLITQKGLIEPILDKPASTKIFATLGLSIVLQNLALMIFDANYLSVTTPYQSSVVNLLGIAISVPRLVSFGVVIAIVILLYLFLQKTMVGRAIRAVSMQRQAAYLVGVNVKRIYLLAFGIGTALVGLAGSMLMPIYSVYPTLGASFVLIAFVVVVLGGMGNMFGAFYGGLMIGVIESLAGVIFSPGLKEVIYFIIFILVLLIKPTGIFSKGKGSEAVGL